MKKTVSFSLSVLILIFAVIPAFAEPVYNDSVYRFNDYFGIVSEENKRNLNQKIDEQIDTLEMDFPICVLDKINGDSPLWEYADSFYERNDFGYGVKRDGILLVYNAENSEYGLFLYGKAENIISDEQKNELLTEFGGISNYESDENYNIIDRYLDSVFALVAEWTESNARMPYWYVEDAASFVNYHAENPPRVVDDAGIFTEEQKAELEKQVNRIVSEYDFSYVIFTDKSTHGLSKDVYAADFLYYGGYGKGDDFSAVCFFLCLEPGNRGWRTVSTNSYEKIFNAKVTYTIDEIVDSDMRAGNYYEAIKKQADYIEKSLETGKFKTIPRAKIDYFGWPMIIGIVIAWIIASTVLSGMKSKMEISSVLGANAYLEKNSLAIRNNSARFLYSTVTRTRKQDRSSGGGGGGSSYSSGHSSSGGSFSSGGRDF